jgi:hypothetical protein
MKWKVTGKARSGRWLPQYDDWEILRQPPKFFVSRQKANHYFEALERGIMWKKNEAGSRNEYSVFATNNMAWPEGARKDNKVKGIYHKRRGLDETMEKSDE